MLLFCSLQNGKGVLAKSVGVIDATADTVFEVLLSTERQKRYEYVTSKNFLRIFGNLLGKLWSA